MSFVQENADILRPADIRWLENSWKRLISDGYCGRPRPATSKLGTYGGLDADDITLAVLTAFFLVAAFYIKYTSTIDLAPQRFEYGAITPEDADVAGTVPIVTGHRSIKDKLGERGARLRKGVGELGSKLYDPMRKGVDWIRDKGRSSSDGDGTEMGEYSPGSSRRASYSSLTMTPDPDYDPDNAGRDDLLPAAGKSMPRRAKAFFGMLLGKAKSFLGLDDEADEVDNEFGEAGGEALSSSSDGTDWAMGRDAHLDNALLAGKGKLKPMIPRPEGPPKGPGGKAEEPPAGSPKRKDAAWEGLFDEDADAAFTGGYLGGSKARGY